MRGLKLANRLNQLVVYVASFTDAWIETLMILRHLLILGVASFTDAWIETKLSERDICCNLGRIFYRCVD